MSNYDPFSNLHLQVLEEQDSECGIWVARCLQTATTVTADDPATLRRLTTEALQLHILLAMEEGNAEMIYYKQATPDVWVRFDAASATNPGEKVTLNVEVPTSVPRRGATSEISIVRSSKRQTA